MTAFSDLVHDFHELEVPKAKEEQFVFRVMKLATTFNPEWLRDPAMITVIKSLGVDDELQPRGSLSLLGPILTP